MHSGNSIEAGSSLQSAPKNKLTPSIAVTNSTSSKTVSKNSKISTTSGKKTSRTAKSLTFIDRRKFIFVSRLTADTHADDVKSFITKKLNIDSSNVNVIKLNSLYKRNISSFKIGVTAQLFDKIVDESFWPSKAVVHEFEFRAKNSEIAVLDTSKN